MILCVGESSAAVIDTLEGAEGVEGDRLSPLTLELSKARGEHIG